MVYRILADAVVITHFMWILFLMFGAFWGVRNRTVKAAHILGLVFAFIVNLFGFECPLTYLEVWLQSKGPSGAAYTGSFISHYLEKVIYIDIPAYAIFLMTALLCAFNAWFYLRKRKQARMIHYS
jgi:hypothetical protein